MTSSEANRGETQPPIGADGGDGNGQSGDLLRLHARTARRAVVPPLVAMGVLALLLLAMVGNLVSAMRWVDHTDQVIARANAAQKRMLDMETGQRGYLIGGDPEFLEPYREAEARVAGELDGLGRLVADNPDQTRRVREVRAGYAAWHENARREIALHDRGGRTTVAPLFNAARGKALMDAQRARFADFLRTEEELRTTRARRAARATTLTLAGGALGALLIGGILAAATRRELRALSDQYALAMLHERDAIARAADERAAAARERERMVREMLFSFTEGRLRLCDTEDDLPAPVGPAVGGEPVALTPATIRDLRRRVQAAAEGIGMPKARWYDLMTSVGEAAMNTVVHGGETGVGRVHADAGAGVVQVRIADRGTGITLDLIHKATLERGFSTAGTLGHGFSLMLQTCDRVYVLTGPAGTTLVLEQDREEALPAWIGTLQPKL